MAFEYDWIRSFMTLEIELIYFFYYVVGAGEVRLAGRWRGGAVER
jgi:hypothetical protein